jgi:hypothetical protein
MAANEDEAEDDVYADKFAERTRAYATLLTTVADLTDPELRAEGFKMLETIRATIVTPRRGQVEKIK